MKYTLLALFIVLSQVSLAQLQIWGANTQSDFTNEATAMAFDANNNLYVTGYITGESAFNPNVTFSSAQGNGDIYVAKYSTTGALIWVKKFGGPMSDRAYDIKVDNNGDIVVSGQYFGTVDFGGQILQSISNSKDIFVVKMNPQGDVLWAVSEGGALGDNMYALAIDQQNNVILTGQFAGSIEIAGQTFNSIVNPDLNQPSYDIFVSKYDSNGTPLWAIHGAAKYEDRGMALDTDNENNIYLAGQFSDTLQFAGQTYNNSGYNVGFLAKLNPSGQIQWFNRMTAGMVLPYDLVVGNDNQISVCGDFLGNLMHHGTNSTQTLTHDFARKVFVSTVNSNGQVQWQRALGSDSELSARGIARHENQIYVTGHFRCALTELQQNSTALFNSIGFRDIYLWNLNASGTSLQTKQMGGKKNDYAYDVQVNSMGQPFICGSYINTLFTPLSTNGQLTNTPNSFGLSNSIPSAYYHLFGDESANSFVSNALNSQTLNYNYFYDEPTDSLNGFISLEDTVHICASGTIGYNTQTDYIAGPDYTFLWNTGSVGQSIGVDSDGDYWVEVSRVDSCVSGSDSVHVIIHQLPEIPLLSDDYPLYTDADLLIENVVYHYCPPYEFQIWFSELAPNTTFMVNGPQTFITDTDPHAYSLSGFYSVFVEDDFCSNNSGFLIIHDTIYEKDIDPLPKFVDPNIVNDTLTLCYGEQSLIKVIDLITNPQMDFTIVPDANILSESFVIECNGTSIPVSPLFYSANFTGTITGWYVLTYTLTTGYDNTCGIDTLFNQKIDSLYVIVNPLPQASTSISLGSLLCPNGSVFITADNVIPGLAWDGPSIDWVSPNNDSIQVSASGHYHYSGQIVDSITGCVNGVGASVFLPEKVPPTVTMNPDDAIVCPYDSVLMSVPNSYVSYTWTGPSGTDLSLTNTLLDAEMGFYYCTVLDDEGCYLTTPPVEIKEFATPYLFVEPTNVLCPGQQVEISAVFTGNGSVNWLPPLAGSALTQNVNEPGWYAAELTACGITVIDSVHILDGSFSPIISASDTLLCYGNDVTIASSIPNAYYVWNNGMEGVNTIQVNEAGNYSAQATNDFGCTAQTNEITITLVEGSAPPNSYSITLCAPGNETLFTNQNIDALWFDANMNPLDSAITYTEFFETSTTILVAYPQDLCPMVFGTIEVIVVEPINPNLAIFGDTLICYHDSTNISIDWTGEISWSLNGTFLSNLDSITLHGTGLQPSNIVTATVQNECQSLSVSIEVVVIPQMSLNPSFVDTTVCPYTQIAFVLDNEISALYYADGTAISNNNVWDIFVDSDNISIDMVALDTMGCYSDTIAIQINVHPSNFSIETVQLPSCVPDSVILTTNLGNVVLWEMSSFTMVSDTFNVLITDADDYIVTATYTDSLGCTQIDQVFFSVAISTPIELPDTIVCIGETIYTHYDYYWDNGFVLIPTDSTQVLESFTLNFIVMNDFGCPFEGQIYVEAIDCISEIPNVITPNGDGVNDVFAIKTAPMEPDNHLVILNRWGNVVFEAKGYNNDFGGGDLPEGVYFYQYNPNSTHHGTKVAKGHLHIIRGH